MFCKPMEWFLYDGDLSQEKVKSLSNYDELFFSKKFSNLSRLTIFFLVFPFDRPENIRKPFVSWCFQGD